VELGEARGLVHEGGALLARKPNKGYHVRTKREGVRMSARSLLLSKIRDYFAEREWKEVSSPEYESLKKFFDLIMQDGNNIVAIKLVFAFSPSALNELRDLVGKCLNVAYGKVDKIYIAVCGAKPVSLLNLKNSFLSGGVGLLIVHEDGRVEERIYPRALREDLKIFVSGKAVEELRSALEQLKVRVQALEAKISGLEELRAGEHEKAMLAVSDLARRVEKLEDKVSRLFQEVERLKRSYYQRVTAREMETPVSLTESSTSEAEGLPSFVQGNPWLSLLSKRTG